MTVPRRTDSVCIGKPARDRTGEPCGPYVVTGPVGDDPRTSRYWRVGCPKCGHTVTPRTVADLPSVATRTKRCGGCGSTP